MNVTSRRIAAGVGAGTLAVAAAVGVVQWPEPNEGGTGGVVAVLDTEAGRFETHGDDTLPPRPAPQVAQMVAEVGWPCEGDGTDGKRVQLLYSGATPLEDHRATFEAYARRMEAQVAASSGNGRLIRFVTEGDCRLSIVEVPLSPAAMASFDATITELGRLGYTDPARKYHLWTDSTTYCGIGTVLRDDRPGSANQSSNRTGYARTDRGCWDYAELHEVMHNLGAVQLSAPNSTGAWHCKDRYDVMCYADGGPNQEQVTGCPNLGDVRSLDCRDDDYFAVAASESSYLGSHHNVAASPYLSTGSPPTTAVPPTTLPPTTVPPTTTTTVGRGETSLDLSVQEGRLRAGTDVAFVAAVTGSCGPTGVVAFRVSGTEVARVIVDGGAARATLRFAHGGRFTARATYLGDERCDTSTDSVRKRVTGA